MKLSWLTRAVGFAPTPAQARFIATAFEGEPSAGDELGVALFGSEVAAGHRDVVILAKGARVGGTRMCSYRLLHLALTVDVRLAPGESAFAVIVGPDLRLAGQAFTFIQGAVNSLPALRAAKVSETASSIVLRRADGQLVTIECLPATRGGSALRGRTLVGAMLTEAAFFRDSASVVNDEEVFRAVSARVVAGGQVIIESTIWARVGLLYELFERHHGNPGRTLAVHAPTLLMRIDAHTIGIVAAERERNPDNAIREYDAVFLDTEGLQALPADWVVRAFRQPEGSAPHNRVGVLDSSSGSGDSFTWCCLEAGFTTPVELPNGERMVSPEGWEYWIVDTSSTKPRPPRPLPKPFTWLHSFDGLRGKFREEVSFDETVERAARQFEALGIDSVYGDQHSAYALESGLRRFGIRYHAQPWTSQNKVDALALARTWFQDSSIYLSAGAHTAVVRDELINLSVKPLPGGGQSIGARGRGHDDFAALILNAAMIAARGQLPGSPISDPRRRPSRIFQG